MILAHKSVLTDNDLAIPADVLSLIAYANKPAFQKAREEKKTLAPKPAATPSASTPAKKEPANRARKGKEVKSTSFAHALDKPFI